MPDIGLPPATMARLAREEIARRAKLTAAKGACEASLLTFLEHAWPYIDPAPFVGGWHLAAIAEHLEAVTRGEIKRLLVNIPPRHCKTLLTAVAWPCWTWALPPIEGNVLQGAGVRFLCASYGANKAQGDGVTARRLIGSTWYQQLWGDRVQIAKDRDNQEQYDNTAGGSRISTGIPESLGKGGVIKLIDDPHKTDEVESDLVRGGSIRAYDEVWSSRSNDPVQSAEVIIMQRLGDRDLSGHIIDQGGVVHLCLPAEYDPARHCRTVLGWSDPRETPGEPLWPERFGPDWLEQQAVRIGPFGYCTPAESPVLMADLSMKPIGQIAVGDELVGFHVPEKGTGKKHRLCRTEVHAISRSIQKVVRVTLENGTTIRCTPDHHWYTGRKDDAHKRYMPPAVGRRLMRVCDPSIRAPIGEEELRAAGWLAGFFDGEGSATYQLREGYEPSVLVTFAQGAERNLPLCHKLEEHLTRFGFHFSHHERVRQDRRYKTAESPLSRWYWLRGNDLMMFQKLLHCIRPTKWRERLIDGGYKTMFIQSEDKIVAIEDDGEEEVFGLTTTTGNYVVWGYASANSGQYQQAPVPRGGGVIKSEWWQVWPPEGEEDSWIRMVENADGKMIERTLFPDWDYVLVSIDTAYGEKQSNDWSACTVWGLFTDKAKRPRLMLVEAWRERMEIHELVTRLSETVKRRKADVLLIEAKASGLSVAQEMRRLMRTDECSIITIDPKGDKTARLHSVVPLFAGGVIHAPKRKWADAVIDEVSAFPRGRHDDFVDSTSQALSYMRRVGLAQLAHEHEADETERLTFRGNKEGVAASYGLT